MTQGQITQAISETARNPQMAGLGASLSDPPTAAEVGAIVNKLNGLIDALRRG